MMMERVIKRTAYGLPTIANMTAKVAYRTIRKPIAASFVNMHSTPFI
ncbi:hypothetical protein [Alteribacter aurantiacus]|nr:hypothetical protein [Alteribacter aurantiacus]